MTQRYTFGQPNAICDRCGFRYPLNELRKEWTGLMVCRDCWEPRHPQEFVRGARDRQYKPNMRPEPEPIFLGPNDVSADDL